MSRPSRMVRLTIDLSGISGARSHEIQLGGWWKYQTDDRDLPHRLIVRPGPNGSRVEYPLANVVAVHVDTFPEDPS